jgi:hypothetical protein
MYSENEADVTSIPKVNFSRILRLALSPSRLIGCVLWLLYQYRVISRNFAQNRFTRLRNDVRKRSLWVLHVGIRLFFRIQVEIIKNIIGCLSIRRYLYSSNVLLRISKFRIHHVEFDF